MKKNNLNKSISKFTETFMDIQELLKEWLEQQPGRSYTLPEPIFYKDVDTDSWYNISGIGMVGNELVALLEKEHHYYPGIEKIDEPEPFDILPATQVVYICDSLPL